LTARSADVVEARGGKSPSQQSTFVSTREVTTVTPQVAPLNQRRHEGGADSEAEMETPFMWNLYRYDAPAGRFPIVLTGAIVALLLVASALGALMPQADPAAETTEADQSDVQLEETRLQSGHSPTAGSDGGELPNNEAPDSA
jgi:hypothetical protein